MPIQYYEVLHPILFGSKAVGSVRPRSEIEWAINSKEIRNYELAIPQREGMIDIVAYWTGKGNEPIEYFENNAYDWERYETVWVLRGVAAPFNIKERVKVKVLNRKDRHPVELLATMNGIDYFGRVVRDSRSSSMYLVEMTRGKGISLPYSYDQEYDTISAASKALKEDFWTFLIHNWGVT